MDLSIISESAVLYIALLMALSVHEFGHAFMADRLGDPLPRLDGRVTLNPLAHMDMLGTVVLPLIMIVSSISAGGGFMIFGWAKPVRVSLPNPKTRVRDDILSTLAGPGMNLALAFICAIICGVLLGSGNARLGELLILFIQINCVLFVFNMLPIPPLDGSHLMKHIVRMSDELYARISSWSLIIILVIINVPATRKILWFLIELVLTPFLILVELIAGATHSLVK